MSRGVTSHCRSQPERALNDKCARVFVRVGMHSSNVSEGDITVGLDVCI